MRTNYNAFPKLGSTPITSFEKTQARAKIEVRPKTGKPIAAGMLNTIIASWMVIGTWIIFTHEQPDSQFVYAALICILIGMFSLVGGVCAFLRKGWELSLVGSICAIPLAYGIISTILIIQSRDEFSHL